MMLMIRKEKKYIAKIRSQIENSKEEIDFLHDAIDMIEQKVICVLKFEEQGVI